MNLLDRPIHRAAVASLLVLGGCVSKAEYTTMLMRVDRLEADRQTEGKELQELRTHNADMSADLDRVRADLRTIRGQIDDRANPANRASSQLRGDFNEDLMAQMLEIRNHVIDLEARLGGPKPGETPLSATPAPNAAAPAGDTPSYNTQPTAPSPYVDSAPSARPALSEPSAAPAPARPTTAASPAAALTTASLASMPPDQQFQAGRNAFQGGHYKEAREAFLAYLAGKPQGDLADDAQFWVGETYFEDRQFDFALPAYDRLIKNYPKSNKVPAALLKQGLCLMSLGYNGDARVQFLKLIDSYPSSDEAKTARDKVKELGGTSASHPSR